jgi:hypothetical protein
MAHCGCGLLFRNAGHASEIDTFAGCIIAAPGKWAQIFGIRRRLTIKEPDTANISTSG